MDLLAPYQKGGKIGLFGGAGVGKTAYYGTNQQCCQSSWSVFNCSRDDVLLLFFFFYSSKGVFFFVIQVVSLCLLVLVSALERAMICIEK